MIKKISARLGLILLGVILAFLVVETCFRLAGFLLTARQEAKNRAALTKEGVYRILCLGESTTQKQWPPFLEEELNNRSGALTFKVIDKGRGGASSGIILSQLEQQLDLFHPNMVVVMMGINDGEWVWEVPVQYENNLSVRMELFLKSTRGNKLLRYISDGLKNIATPQKRIDSFIPETSTQTPVNAAWTYLNAGNRYREDGELEKAKELYKAAMKADPKNVWSYVGLAEIHRQNGFDKMAEQLFDMALKVDPHQPRIYLGYGSLCRENGEMHKARKLYEAGIKANPTDSWLYLALGQLHRDMEDFPAAIKYYEAGLKADPKHSWIYWEYGNTCKKIGDYEKANRLYELGTRIDPKNSWLYFALGQSFLEKNAPDEAAKMFESAINADPTNHWVYLELARIYEDRGEREKRHELLSRGYATFKGNPTMSGAMSLSYLKDGNEMLMEEYRKSSYLPLKTGRNYINLRDIVLKRGIKLVCMQYPMRDVRGLKALLGNDSRIVFVENRKNFEAALRTNKLTEIFSDMFGGDFGHCTELGNRLIAENLSNAILTEVFGKYQEDGRK